MRGYGYQQLGPKDMDGDPIGGRGLAEFALEARIRLKQFGGNFGVVPFFDGGSLTTEALPDFKNWRFAAGLGVRYYSSFGPIRIDVGVPLNRQKGDGPVRGHRLARPGVLGWPRPPSPTKRAPPPTAAAARLAAAAAQRAVRRCSSRCCSCSPARWCCSTRAPGHRFIVDRIARFETASGLNIRIGRIDGSIFGKSQLQERHASPTAAASS